MRLSDDRHKSNAIIGRFNFFDWNLGAGQDPINRVIDLVANSEKYDDPNQSYVWRFGNGRWVPVEKSPYGRVYFGRLGKVRRSQMDTFFDESKKEFMKNQTQHNRATYSNFIIQPEKHFIVFEEKKPDFTYGYFVDYFTRIFREKYNDATISILPLLKTTSIFKELHSFEKITNAKFNIKPSNPDSYQEFKQLEDTLKKARATKASLEFQNKQEGLNVDDSVIQEAIYLSDAGYGDYEIKGQRDGQDQSVASYDNIIRRRLKCEDNYIDVSESFYDYLKPYLKSGKK